MMKWITAPKARALVALTWTGRVGWGKDHVVATGLGFLHSGAWPGCILCLCSTHGPRHFPCLPPPGIGVEGRTVRSEAHAPC